jgi:ADP-heptose:LPS heptosyltransferase
MIEKLEYWWRHQIVYPFLRSLLHNPEYNAPIDIHTIGNILFLRYDRIGDMIVTTPIFRRLKELHPQLKIGVFASETNAAIIRNNPFVDSIYVLHSNWLKLIAEIIKARKSHYRIIVNFIFNRTSSGGLLANLIAPSGIKIGQGDDKYRFYFNRLLKIDRNKSHMIETLAFIIKEVFNIHLTIDELKYEIVVDKKTKNDVDTYLAKNNLLTRHESGNGKSGYIVFNLSANDSVRKISTEQAYAVGRYLNSCTAFQTVLLHAPQDLPMMVVQEELVKTTRCLPFPDRGDATILELAALIEGAMVVITPDTSIIHFASAANTPVIGFYTAMQDVHEWLPHQVKHRLVISPVHTPTSAIPQAALIDAISGFIGELEIPLLKNEV